VDNITRTITRKQVCATLDDDDDDDDDDDELELLCLLRVPSTLPYA
jgi:hypothetical protein